MSEITRFQFALNSNNSEVVKAGLAEIVSQVYAEDESARLKVMHANTFTTKPDLNPWDLPLVKQEDFILSKFLRRSPQLEEVFMIWDTDVHDDNLLSALRSIFFTLLLGQMEKNSRRELAQKLLKLYSKAIKDQLLASDPRTRACTLLLLCWTVGARCHLSDSILEAIKESLSKTRTHEDDFSFSNSQELVNLVHYRLIGIRLLVQFVEFDLSKGSKIFLEDQAFLSKLLVDVNRMQESEVGQVLLDISTLFRLYPKLTASITTIFASSVLSKELFPDRQDISTSETVFQFWKDWLPRLELAKDQQKVDNLCSSLISVLKPLSSEMHKKMEVLLLERRVSLLSKSLKKLKSLTWNSLTADEIVLRLEHIVSLIDQFGASWIDSQKEKSSSDDRKVSVHKPIIFLTSTGITKLVFSSFLSHSAVAVNTLACRLYGHCVHLLQRQLQGQPDRHFGEGVLEILPDPSTVFTVWTRLSSLLNERSNPTTSVEVRAEVKNEDVETLFEDIEIGIEGGENEISREMVMSEPIDCEQPNSVSVQELRDATLSAQLTEYLSSLPLIFETNLPSTMLTSFEPLKCLELLLTFHSLEETPGESPSQPVTANHVLLMIELLLLVVKKRQMNWFGSLEDTGKSLISCFANEDWPKSYRPCRCSQLLELFSRVKSKLRQLSAETGESPSERDGRLVMELLLVERALLQLLQTIVHFELRPYSTVPSSFHTSSQQPSRDVPVEVLPAYSELESLVWIRCCMVKEESKPRTLLLDLILRLVKHFRVDITWYWLQFDKPPFLQFTSTFSTITQTIFLLYFGHFNPFLSLFAQYMQKYLQTPIVAEATGRQGFLKNYLQGFRRDIEQLLQVGLEELVILSQEPWKVVNLVEAVLTNLPNYLDGEGRNDSDHHGVRGLLVSLPRFNNALIESFSTSGVKQTNLNFLSTKELKKLLKRGSVNSLQFDVNDSVRCPTANALGITQLLERIMLLTEGQNLFSDDQKNEWEVAVQSLQTLLQRETAVSNYSSTLSSRLAWDLEIPGDVSLLVITYLALFNLILSQTSKLRKEDVRRVLSASDNLCRHFLEQLSLVIPHSTARNAYLFHHGFIQSGLWATSPFGMVCRRVAAMVLPRLRTEQILLLSLPSPQLSTDQAVLLRNDQSFLLLIEELIFRLSEYDFDAIQTDNSETARSISTLRPLFLFYLDYRVESFEQLVSREEEDDTRGDPLRLIWSLLSPSDVKLYVTRILQTYLQQAIKYSSEGNKDSFSSFLSLFEPPNSYQRKQNNRYVDVRYLLRSQLASPYKVVELPDITVSDLLQIPLSPRISFLEGILRLFCDSPLHSLLYHQSSQSDLAKKSLVRGALDTHVKMVSREFTSSNTDFLLSYHQLWELCIASLPPGRLLEELLWRDGERCLYGTAFLDLLKTSNAPQHKFLRLNWNFYLQFSLSFLSPSLSAASSPTEDLQLRTVQRVLDLLQYNTQMEKSDLQSVLSSSPELLGLLDKWLKSLLKYHVDSPKIMKLLELFLQELHHPQCYQIFSRVALSSPSTFQLQTSALHPLQFLRFVVTHSKITAALSVKASDEVISKIAQHKPSEASSSAAVVLNIILKLLVVIVEIPESEKGTIWTKVVERIEELLSDIYEGSLSEGDQVVLHIFSLLMKYRDFKSEEPQGTKSASDTFPSLYLPNPLPSKSLSLVSAPLLAFQRLVDFLKPDRIHHTINHYPLFRRLTSFESSEDTDPISYDPLLMVPLVHSILEAVMTQLPPPPPLPEEEVEVDSRSDSKKRKRSSSDVEEFEPVMDEGKSSYVIPYLRRFVNNGGLALLIANLSSSCDRLRLLSLASLQRLFVYLQRTRDSEAADLNYRDRAAILTLLTLVRQSLLAIPSASAPGSPDSGWLPVTLSQFLARASMIVMSFHHPLHAIVSKVLVRKPVLVADKDLPLFEEILFSQHSLVFATSTSNSGDSNQQSQTLYAKLFVLRMMRDSLRTTHEHHCFVRRNVYQRLLLLSPFLSSDSPKLLLVVVEILEKTMFRLVSAEKAASPSWQGFRYLVHKCQLLHWVSSLVRQMVDDATTSTSLSSKGSLLVALVSMTRQMLHAMRWMQTSRQSGMPGGGEEDEEFDLQTDELSLILEQLHAVISHSFGCLSGSLTVPLAEELLRSNVLHEMLLLASDYCVIGPLLLPFEDSGSRTAVSLQCLSSFMTSWMEVMGDRSELTSGFYFGFLSLVDVIESHRQRGGISVTVPEELTKELSQIVNYCQKELMTVAVNTGTASRSPSDSNYLMKSWDVPESWREAQQRVRDAKIARISLVEPFLGDPESLKALLRGSLLVQLVLLPSSNYLPNLSLVAAVLSRYSRLFTRVSNGEVWWGLPAELIAMVIRYRKEEACLSTAAKKSLECRVFERSLAKIAYDVYEELFDGFLTAVESR